MLIIALLTAVAAAPSAVAPTNIEAGAKLYAAKCGTCHSIEVSKIGPAHRGVVGRAAGTYPGYAYSAAMKAAKIIWTPDNLDMWLQGPQKMVKGVKMYLIVPNPADRSAIIAYLSSPAGR